MCLFDVLLKLARQSEWTLHAVHVNHKFRPGAAEADQSYVESLCAAAGVNCTVYAYDCATMASELGISSEEAGRKARYEAFALKAAEVAAKFTKAETDPDDMHISRTSVKIALAHNYNDQAETVMMRIIRGTGTDGLSGMEYSRVDDSGFEIIRPLLDVKRVDIEHYCRERRLEPRTDATNLTPLYNRNKIRLELIPYIDLNFDSNITDSLNRLARITAEDSAYITSISDEVYETAQKATQGSAVSLMAEPVRNCALPIKKRVLLRAMKDAGLVQDMTEAHLAAAVKLIDKDITSSRLDFPHGFRIRIGYDDIIISRVDDNTGEDIYPSDGTVAGKSGGTIYEKYELLTEIAEINGVGQYNNRRRQELAGKIADMGIVTALFDYDKICMQHGSEVETCIELRTRREGDRICINSAGNSQKLKKYFIDSKIPAEIRNKIPIVAIGKELLLIAVGAVAAGFNNRYSKKYEVNDETKRILRIRIIEKR